MKDKDNFYIGLAEKIAEASYCERLKVGSLIVKDDNIISFGYNGTPKGFDNICENVLGETKKETLHAESNAITKCAKYTGSSKGATLYTTVASCFECAKLILQAGIIRVVYRDEYRDMSGISFLKTIIDVKRVQ